MEQPNPSPSASLNPEIARLHEAVADLQQRVAALEMGTGRVRSASTSTPTQSAESRFGLTIVNGAGAITLAIGIVFFFKYAVDNEWIGPAGRVILGLAGGLVLLAAARWLRRRNQQAFSQGLAGCGLATLYISVYAASAYYKLLGQPLAFVALLGICVLPLIFSVRHSSAATAAVGFSGALLTPMLLTLMQPEGWATFELIYLLLLSLTGLAIASRQGWRLLVPLLASLATLAALTQLDGRHPHLFVFFMVCLAAANFVLAAWFTQVVRIRSYPYVTGHAALLIALLRVVDLWARQNIVYADRGSFASETGSVLLAVYGIATLAFGIAWSSALNRSLGLVLLGIVVAKLYLYDVWLLTRFYRISAFVALGILLLAASYIYSRFKTRTSAD